MDVCLIFLQEKPRRRILFLLARGGVVVQLIVCLALSVSAPEKWLSNIQRLQRLPSRLFSYSGVSADPVLVNVTALNPVTVQETFLVSANSNSTLIGTRTVTLAARATMIVSFSWRTVSLATGNCVLSASASQVTGETKLSNYPTTTLLCREGSQLG